MITYVTQTSDGGSRSLCAVRIETVSRQGFVRQWRDRRIDVVAGRVQCRLPFVHRRGFVERRRRWRWWKRRDRATQRRVHIHPLRFRQFDTPGLLWRQVYRQGHIQSLLEILYPFDRENRYGVTVISLLATRKPSCI